MKSGPGQPEAENGQFLAARLLKIHESWGSRSQGFETTKTKEIWTWPSCRCKWIVFLLCTLTKKWGKSGHPQSWVLKQQEPKKSGPGQPEAENGQFLIRLFIESYKNQSFPKQRFQGRKHLRNLTQGARKVQGAPGRSRPLLAFSGFSGLP